MRIIFVRHGQTDTNVRFHAGEVITEDDAPLNEEGRKQAAEVARQLKDEQIDIIFSSPYKRAKGTAEAIAQYHDAKIVEISDLRERACGDLIGNQFNELFDFDKDIRGEDIEPIHDFFTRIYNVIEQIKASGYDNIAVVSHGGVYHAFRAYFDHLEWRGYMRKDKLKNCEYCIFEA